MRKRAGFGNQNILIIITHCNYYMIRSKLVGLIFIILILLIPNAKANEDQAYLYVKQGEETDNYLVVYKGETVVYAKIIFGQNCSSWSTDVSSPLFTRQGPLRTQQSITAGRKHNLPLNIDPNAPIGKYPITVYFNYTTDINLNISNQFNFTIQYKKALEIKELNLPKGFEREFSLKIETFEKFEKLEVEFDSDGDIETKKHEIILENISTGNYTFKTKIYRRESSPENAQELGYWIIGEVNNRTIEFGEKNIPANIEWGVGEGFIPGFEIIFLVISFLILIIWRKKRKIKPSREKQARG